MHTYYTELTQLTESKIMDTNVFPHKSSSPAEFFDFYFVLCGKVDTLVFFFLGKESMN